MMTGGRRHRTIKRAIDIVGSVALLIVLSPALLAAAVVVKTTSRGPVIFRQERVGLNGQPFEILKFRSMVVDNDDSEHRAYASRLLIDPLAEPGTGDHIFKLDDARVTAAGTVMRRYSIDELPQLWNVLRGEMSLVGPRPMLDWEVELLSERHRRRLDGYPGCTGLWQVSGRSRLSTHEMLEADLAYIDTWSPSRDLQILLKTPLAIWSTDGTR